MRKAMLSLIITAETSVRRQPCLECRSLALLLEGEESMTRVFRIGAVARWASIDEICWRVRHALRTHIGRDPLAETCLVPGQLPARTVHGGIGKALSECDPKSAAGLTGCTPCRRWPRETPHCCLLDAGSTLIGVNVHGPPDSDNRMRTQRRTEADACPDL